MSRRNHSDNVLVQMQSCIRPLKAGFLVLRALMQSALPLLINLSAFADLTNTRVWGSRSDLSCHHG
jgi:hypothetical protein